MIEQQIKQHEKCLAILQAISWEQNRMRRLEKDINLWKGFSCLSDCYTKWIADLDFKARVIIKLWKYYKKEVEKL